MNLRRSRVILAASFSMLLLASPSLAAGNEDPANAPIGWVFRWLNFALVFGGGGYLLVKRARAPFQQRGEKIAAAIAAKARILEEALARLRQAEEKLQGIPQETEKLRAAGRQEALVEAERIQALALEEAKKNERAAQAEIEAAERAARGELKALTAHMAVERAEAVLREKLTPQADEGLLRFFVNSLARSAN